MDITLDYVPSLTLHAFHRDDSFVRGVMGPIGSGKSVAMVSEIVNRAGQQKPGKDGVRRSRWAIIRNTYPELKSTTIKTWSEWVNERFCPITFGAPITGHLAGIVEDPVTGERSGLDAEIIFLALDTPRDVKKLLSLELTGAWVNEAREVARPVVDMLTGRVGRYPALRDGGPSWSGIILDSNPPDDDHWWYKLAEVEKPDGWRFWEQPPAIIRGPTGAWIGNPAAENVQNHALGYDYWLRQIPGKSDEWIRVYLEGRYGTIIDGRPVWPEYSDQVHCSESSLDPFRGLPIILGWDFGLTPACVFCQLTLRGQLRVLHECCSNGIGIRDFARLAVKPVLASKFGGMTVKSWGDPAGAQRSQVDERSCFDELAAQGIPIEPASTNTFTARREAVAGFLTRLSDGKPAFQVSPECVNLRKALKGKYYLQRVEVTGEERFKDEPAKNIYSHVAEALQYAALSVDTVYHDRPAPARPTKVIPRRAFM